MLIRSHRRRVCCSTPPRRTAAQPQASRLFARQSVRGHAPALRTVPLLRAVGSAGSYRSMAVRHSQWAVLVACLLWSIGCAKQERVADADSRGTSPVAPAADYAATAAPNRPESDFLNTAPGVKYVGTDTCQSCHADVHAGFLQTRHSRSMSDASQQNSVAASIEHPESGYAYETRTEQGGQLVHCERVLLDGREETPREILVKWVVGSGRFGRSYLAERDGFLVQSPLTWYSDRRAWDMSPGYDFPGQFSFRRAVSAGCLYCHAGPVESPDGNDYHVQIHENFVSCERCHGPGELHVRKHTAEDTAPVEIDHSIVNPAHLDRELQEAICQQCHLQADTQVIVRGFDFDDYRPGLPLSAFRRDYRFGGSDDQMTIVGHVEQMHRSRCFTETADLTCTTCHHPHPEDQAVSSLDGYRNTCLTCHADQDCGESPQQRQQQADNHCTICHMPSSPTEVPHVAFTHHRIGIHKPQATPPSSGRSRIISMLARTGLPRADQARVDGLAALGIYQMKPEARDETLLRGARELLQEAWEGGAGDIDVAAGLANIAEITQYDDMIDAWGTQALRMSDEPSEGRATALQVVSELRFRQERFIDAYELLEELTSIRRDARAWFYRGLVAQNLKDTEDAIRSLQMAIDIDPRNAAAHSVLATLFELKNDVEQSDYHRQMARDLQ